MSVWCCEGDEWPDTTRVVDAHGEPIDLDNASEVWYHAIGSGWRESGKCEIVGEDRFTVPTHFPAGTKIQFEIRWASGAVLIVEELIEVVNAPDRGDSR